MIQMMMLKERMNRNFERVSETKAKGAVFGNGVTALG